MKRVDYLFCRIKQLLFRRFPHAWAVHLTRLELGERPSGQKRVHMIEPRRLFSMVLVEMRGRRGIQWRSPVTIDEASGRILALVLRILTTGRRGRLRTEADGVSVLTMANIDAVVPIYSFFTSPRNKKRPFKERAFESWLRRHQQDISRIRAQLLPLVDCQGVAGFSSYDG